MYLTLQCYSSSHQPRFLEVASNVSYLWSWRGVLEHRVVAEDRPIQMVSHFNVKHISGVLPPSYAVDVHIKDLFLPGLLLIVSTKLLEVALSTCICPYHVTAALLSQAFGSFPLIPGTSRDANQSIVWCLRLKTHSSGLPHQYQTYIR